MKTARILWTLCAIATAAIFGWSVNGFATDLLRITPYQGLPLTVWFLTYMYLAALAVAVGAARVIWTIWTDEK